MSDLRVVPTTLAEANAYVEAFHRHHKPVPGAKFCIAVADMEGGYGEEVCGVAIVGRPVARHLDDGWTLEVNRVATDGVTKNVCSMLYGACWRAARALGYNELITYTLESEGGASLRGAGWKCLGRATTRVGQGWSVKSRPRVDTHPLQAKLKWCASGAAQGDKA